MKKILVLFLIAVMIANYSYGQKVTTLVGKIQNGTPVLTIDKTTLLKVYNAKLLAYSKIDGKFNNVEIKLIEGKNYALIFSGSVYKSTFFVEAVGDELKALATTACTTSDCSSEKYGCIVKYDGGDYGYCTECQNKGKCTKTTTSSSMLE